MIGKKLRNNDMSWDYSYSVGQTVVSFIQCDWCGGQDIPEYMGEMVHCGDKIVHLCHNCKDKIVFSNWKWFWDSKTKKRDTVGVIWHQGLKIKE
jgi:hypothetical protein